MHPPDKTTPEEPRYFARPDPGEKPLAWSEILVIVLCTHLGVRPKKKREEDFRRANGLHLFIAGLLYFSLLVVGLALLVRYLTR